MKYDELDVEMSHEGAARVRHFQLNFKMATAATFDFLKFNILTVNLTDSPLDGHVLRHHRHVKFCVNRSYCCRNIAIFHVFLMNIHYMPMCDN